MDQWQCLPGLVAAPGSLPAAGAGPCGLAGMRVLVVDDEPMVAMTFADFLELAGCQVRTAADGIEALAVAESWFCDLLVTDLDMPRLDGFGLIGRMRLARPWLPVIVVTGSDAGLPPAAAAEGLLRLLRKPVGPADLLALAARLVCPLARHPPAGCGRV